MRCTVRDLLATWTANHPVPHEFFLGPLTTALEPDEILTDVVFPPWAGGPAMGL